jgi:hypothetical protein
MSSVIAMHSSRQRASAQFEALSRAQMRVMSIVIERAFPPQCVEAFEHSEWLVTQSTTTKNASPVGG